MGADQSYLVGPDVKQTHVNFYVNGKEYSVNPSHDNVGGESRLVDYIRENIGLKGTKFTCREGGCGACVVSVKTRDPSTGADIVRAVNSCLVPVLSADGWDITTVEGLGSQRSGYHKIQEQIVNFSGTQCGFCTPGMVMNMYSLTKSKPTFKAEEVESSFDGNLCRCTGYRPILDAFKSMAVDASEELKRKCVEVSKDSCWKKTQCCQASSNTAEPAPPDDFERYPGNSQVYLKFQSGEEWIRATTLETMFEALQRFTSSGMKYRIVAGNTGTGVYKNDGPYQAFLDINGIAELKAVKIDPSGVELGGCVTLSDAIDLLEKASELDGYFYGAQMSKHIKRVANTPVRNVATLAGNLMLKHAHREFPSDIFLLLETVGAKLNIGTSPTVARDYSLLEFRDADMNGKVILSIRLPPYRGGQYYMKTFKITRRYQNAHAYVNAGFLMKVDPKRNFSVREKPTFVFGGINPDFVHGAFIEMVHAIGTEIFFVGKFLEPKTIRNAMEYIEKELQPNNKPPDASPQYRKALAQSLLYKFLLGILGNSVSPKFKSGSQEIERNLMYGKQDYDTDKSEWPLYQPIPKLEARVQASGEAQYVNDICPEGGELFGAFVLSTVGNASLKNIDASEALMMPGVVSFLQAKDIPGLNNHAIFYPQPDEIFAKEKIQHAGQPVGMIVAENREIAFLAAKKVAVMYDDVQVPILDIKTSLSLAKTEGRFDKCLLQIRKSITEPVSGAHTITGEFEIASQYHFHMETQTCICIPREDGMDVFAATQFPNSVQCIIAAALGKATNSINVTVRRLGGAYGAKISKASHVAAACAVAAQVTGKPVRVVMDLETNMKAIGKRLPYFAKYEVGVDDSGIITNLKCEVFCDPGHNANEETSLFAMLCMQNCYSANGWQVIPGKVLTNTPANTFCRAPGSTQGIAIIETIMEHIASYLKMDPLQIRMNNFMKKGDPIFGIPGLTFQEENPLPQLIKDLKASADYDDRVKFIDHFNETNRWKKRGISLVPMRYPMHYPDYIARLPVYIAVYALDGMVAVSHGGIEMGQGINTKVAQVVAHTLKIPLEKIQIKPTNTLISPNADLTGAAITSELVCHAAVEASKQLLEKMEPVRSAMKDAPWEQVVGACYGKHILLTAHYQGKHNDVIPYEVWGLTLTEVEVDILTGEFKIVRVDLVEDAGQSLSPEVDIGQIEGAYIMGLGMWTSEKLVYDKNTGELLTHNTWEYKPPFPKCIPEDFRVTMLKNRPNPHGVLRSKATGEPPITMSVGVIFAIRHAIDSARHDIGNHDWYQMNGPLTPEDIHHLSMTTRTQFDI